jgi:hypothetical protein
MDRYQGEQVFNAEELAEHDALEALAHHNLIIERRRWEADSDAIAEYESWFLSKTIMEADAENLDVR